MTSPATIILAAHRGGDPAARELFPGALQPLHRQGSRQQASPPQGDYCRHRKDGARRARKRLLRIRLSAVLRAADAKWKDLALSREERSSPCDPVGKFRPSTCSHISF